ncbi:MAG TPA: hypothetical protein VHC69_28650 [Polyangiaceae bacterium]|nr:hypothetical protein [Polyangiaceae bacterium]
MPNTARIMPADPMTRASELLTDGSSKIYDGIADLAEALATYDEHGEDPGAGWRELHDACKAVYELSLKAIPD